MDVSAPTSAFTSVIDAAEALADASERRELTQSERRRLIDAGAALLLNPPSANSHLGLAYGLLKDFEIAGRLVTGGVRLGARYQILRRSTDGIDLSAGLGVSRYTFAFPVDSVLDVLEVDDYERWQVDLPILLGRSGTWYRWWAGPRVVVGRYDAGLRLNLPAISGVSEEETFAVGLEGTGAYLGGQIGAALGYKHVFLAAELTVVRFGARARVTTSGAEVGNFDVERSGAIFYPGIAVLGEL